MPKSTLTTGASSITESQPDVNGGNVGRQNMETHGAAAHAAEQGQHLELDAIHHAGDGRPGVQEQLGPPAAADGPAPLQLVHAAAPVAEQQQGAVHRARITCSCRTDRGATWRLVSPDLSKNDPERTIRKSGGMTPDENPGGGAEYHATIITISESPIETGNIWVGTDDGNIQVTRDGGKTWTRVGTRACRACRRPTCGSAASKPSHHTRGVAYATVDGHRMAKLRPVRSSRRPTTASRGRASRGNPDRTVIRRIRVKEDLKNPNLLFTGSASSPSFYSLERRAVLAAAEQSTTADGRRSARRRSSIRATTTWSPARTGAASGSWTTSRRSSR